MSFRFGQSNLERWTSPAGRINGVLVSDVHTHKTTVLQYTGLLSTSFSSRWVSETPVCEEGCCGRARSPKQMADLDHHILSGDAAEPGASASAAWRLPASSLSLQTRLPRDLVNVLPVPRAATIVGDASGRPAPGDPGWRAVGRRLRNLFLNTIRHPGWTIRLQLSRPWRRTDGRRPQIRPRKATDTALLRFPRGYKVPSRGAST